MSRFITYLALERPAAISADQTISAFRSLLNGAPMRIDDAGPVTGAPGEGFIVTVNGVPVTVMFIDRPLPEDAWREAAAGSLVWRDAAETMRRTQAHVIVALLEEPADHPHALNGAAAVTLVGAAVAKDLPVAAVVFTESNAILPGRDLGGIAAEFARGRVPDTLWTRISFLRGAPVPGGTPTVAAFTTGLAAFIGREIEFQPAPLQPVEVAQRLVGLCQYLIVNGPVIRDGETVGLSEREKIRVRHAPAGQRPGVPVLLMSLEVADPAVSGPQTARPAAPARPGAGIAARQKKPFGKRGL